MKFGVTHRSAHAGQTSRILRVKRNSIIAGDGLTEKNDFIISRLSRGQRGEAEGLSRARKVLQIGVIRGIYAFNIIIERWTSCR